MRTLFVDRRFSPRSVFGRDFDAGLFAQRLKSHLRRWGLVYLLAAVAWAFVCTHFRLGLNVSPSLPQTLYLIEKGVALQRGELVAFRWRGGGAYPAGATFVKILAGLPGDAVTRAGSEFLVNGVSMGTAKTVSRRGEPLEPGPTGLIPPGRYYVRAPHPDSLDSRYRLTGWIDASQIIGRAHALF
jgi:conjugal transfer pilin signal peptidase TrbI